MKRPHDLIAGSEDRLLNRLAFYTKRQGYTRYASTLIEDRQTYDDLITDSEFSASEKEYFRLFVKCCFDRIELGFCTKWAGLSEDEKTLELQSAWELMPKINGEGYYEVK